jgi:hypothetical protein
MPIAAAVLSDPRSGSDDAFGRVFNAPAPAYDYRHAGDEVPVLFQGAGTRWIGELARTEHPAHAPLEAARDTVAGVSAGCAAAFAATDDAVGAGFELLTDNPVPKTPGLPSLRKLIGDGHTVVTF